MIDYQQCEYALEEIISNVLGLLLLYILMESLWLDKIEVFKDNTELDNTLR